MLNKFQKILMILGVLLAILGIAFNKNINEVFLNITIILWILNAYLNQRTIEELENKL